MAASLTPSLWEGTSFSSNTRLILLLSGALRVCLPYEGVPSSLLRSQSRAPKSSAWQSIALQRTRVSVSVMAHLPSRGALPGCFLPARDLLSLSSARIPHTPADRGLLPSSRPACFRFSVRGVITGDQRCSQELCDAVSSVSGGRSSSTQTRQAFKCSKGLGPLLNSSPCPSRRPSRPSSLWRVFGRRLFLGPLSPHSYGTAIHGTSLLPPSYYGVLLCRGSAPCPCARALSRGSASNLPEGCALKLLPTASTLVAPLSPQR
jgi:hypothetical protein